MQKAGEKERKQCLHPCLCPLVDLYSGCVNESFENENLLSM